MIDNFGNVDSKFVLDEGLLNMYVIAEGERGVNEIYDKQLLKFRNSEGGVSTNLLYIGKIYAFYHYLAKILLYFLVYSFTIASNIPFYHALILRHISSFESHKNYFSIQDYMYSN